jgi:hypothetical protein
VIEQNEKHPRGWGKGVCNTPLHADIPVDGARAYAMRPYMRTSPWMGQGRMQYAPTCGHPRGWGKGVCNTPLHAVTEYTNIVRSPPLHRLPPPHTLPILPPPKQNHSTQRRTLTENRRFASVWRSLAQGPQERQTQAPIPSVSWFVLMRCFSSRPLVSYMR